MPAHAETKPRPVESLSREEQVRRRAEVLYRLRGGRPGSAMEDWLRGVDFTADGVDAQIGAIHECLKLRGAPADVLEPIEIALVECLHDRPDEASGGE
jgi:hypothetical protein